MECRDDAGEGLQNLTLRSKEARHIGSPPPHAPNTAGTPMGHHTGGHGHAHARAGGVERESEGAFFDRTGVPGADLGRGGFGHAGAQQADTGRGSWGFGVGIPEPGSEAMRGSSGFGVPGADTGRGAFGHAGTAQADPGDGDSRHILHRWKSLDLPRQHQHQHHLHHQQQQQGPQQSHDHHHLPQTHSTGSTPPAAHHAAGSFRSALHDALSSHPSIPEHGTGAPGVTPLGGSAPEDTAGIPPEQPHPPLPIGIPPTKGASPSSSHPPEAGHAPGVPLAEGSGVGSYSGELALGTPPSLAASGRVGSLRLGMKLLSETTLGALQNVPVPAVPPAILPVEAIVTPVEAIVTPRPGAAAAAVTRAASGPTSPPLSPVGDIVTSGVSTVMATVTQECSTVPQIDTASSGTSAGAAGAGAGGGIGRVERPAREESLRLPEVYHGMEGIADIHTLTSPLPSPSASASSPGTPAAIPGGPFGLSMFKSEGRRSFEGLKGIAREGGQGREGDGSVVHRGAVLHRASSGGTQGSGGTPGVHPGDPWSGGSNQGKGGVPVVHHGVPGSSDQGRGGAPAVHRGSPSKNQGGSILGGSLAPKELKEEDMHKALAVLGSS